MRSKQDYTTVKKHDKVAVDDAGKLGMKMCLCDEFWFPRGPAGGPLAQKHPKSTCHRGPTTSRWAISVEAK